MTEDRFDRWLFAPRAPTGIALFRILLGVILLQRYLPRIFFMRELYGVDALMMPRGLVELLHVPEPTPRVATALMAILVASFAAVTVGFLTRWSAAMAAVLLYYFVAGNLVFECAVDTFGIFSLALIAISPAGRVLSLDRWLAMRKGLQPPEASSPFAQRFLCLIFVTHYVFSPILRLQLHGWGFLGGAPLAGAFSGWQFETAASQFVSGQPWIMVPISIGSTLGEWFIAVGLFVRRLRPYAIVAGVLLHGFVLVSILIPPGLSLIMMASYVLFVDPETLQQRLNPAAPRGTRTGRHPRACERRERA